MPSTPDSAPQNQVRASRTEKSLGQEILFVCGAICAVQNVFGVLSTLDNLTRMIRFLDSLVHTWRMLWYPVLDKLGLRFPPHVKDLLTILGFSLMLINVSAYFQHGRTFVYYLQPVLSWAQGWLLHPLKTSLARALSSLRDWAHTLADAWRSREFMYFLGGLLTVIGIPLFLVAFVILFVTAAVLGSIAVIVLMTIQMFAVIRYYAVSTAVALLVFAGLHLLDYILGHLSFKP